MYTRTLLLMVGVATVLSLVTPVDATANDGLLAHWTLDDTTGGVIEDSSGHGFDGTLHGGVRVAGPLGGAVSFDGIDDDIWIPDQTSPPPGELTSLQTGSIALWFRYEDTDREADPLFYLGDQYELTGPDGIDRGGPGLVIELGHPENDKLYVTVFTAKNYPTWCFDTGFNLEPGRWYHAVVVVGDDFNTGYLDGIELVDRHYNYGRAANTQFFGDFADADRLTLGSGLYKNQTTAPLNGMLDDVRIYNRPLTADEVWALYDGSEPSNLPPSSADDQATVAPGQEIQIEVLANDSDPNGDALAVGPLTQPSHGQARTDGTTVTYTPEAGFEGEDRFTYTAVDPAGATDTATVTVTVTPDVGTTDPPARPTGLQVLSVTARSVQLGWSDTSSGANQETGFEVQRANRTLLEGWTTIATTAADAFRYDDRQADDSTVYVYRVRAVNLLGPSQWSNRIRVVTLD